MVNNQLINNSLDIVSKAISVLANKDLTVISYRHDHAAKPTIEVEHHPFCTKMIESGAAAYFMHATPYRFGQFELEGCRVVWKERDTYRLN